ncbi:MAG TPA: DUF5076 domain-containing protein [Xanthobacteraceae bacterium]|nr:DUF5076 domain-containing protein [Xanthobacteraceae bacterium]
MSETDEKSTYEPLDIPGEARERGGVEILRAGMMSDELFVAARPAFDDPAMWGEVLADITRRLSRLYAADGKYTYKDALVAIESAFAADLGAPVVQKTPRKAKRPKLRAKAPAKTRAKARAKTPAKKAGKRKAR